MDRKGKAKKSVVQLVGDDAPQSTEEIIAVIRDKIEQDLPDALQEGKELTVLDVLVMRTLRPILQEWLDKHLPPIVEQMARERAARK